jgi:hypothetical protein
MPIASALVAVIPYMRAVVFFGFIVIGIVRICFASCGNDIATGRKRVDQSLAMVVFCCLCTAGLFMPGSEDWMDIPWKNFNSPETIWTKQPSFVVVEITFIVLALCTLYHAIQTNNVSL